MKRGLWLGGIEGITLYFTLERNLIRFVARNEVLWRIAEYGMNINIKTSHRTRTDRSQMLQAEVLPRLWALIAGCDECNRKALVGMGVYGGGRMERSMA